MMNILEGHFRFIEKILVNPVVFRGVLGVLSSPFQVSDEKVNMMQHQMLALGITRTRDVTTHPH